MPDDPQPVPYDRFQQVDTEKNTLKAELDQLKSQIEAEKQANDVAKGEWEKLARKHETKLNELEPKYKSAEQEVTLLRKVLNDQLTADVDKLPPELKALVPTTDDYEARSAMLAKLKPLAEKLTPTTTTVPGSAPRPAAPNTPATTAPDTDAVAKAKAELIATGRYGL
jgi:paraquat-inducible protein B